MRNHITAIAGRARARVERARDRIAGVAEEPGRSAETGMATAEYAIATVAAAGFAGLLVVILRSGDVRELLLGIIRGALSV